jgi:beta-xylosidase
VAAGVALAIAAPLVVVIWSQRASASRLPVLSPVSAVYDGDIGDPFVLPVQRGPLAGEFFVLGTNDFPSHVPTAHSTDLQHWEAGPDALPTLPAWASPDRRNSLTWAPAVLETPVQYVMYVSVQDSASHRECISAATSANPDGPYRDAVGSPFVCQPDLGGSIDPSVFRDEAGDLHLLWKSDGNCCNLASVLWEQGLSADGLHLTGSPHRLLQSSLAWQGGIVENPALTPAQHGGYWLFYSANLWNRAEYGTGLAFCREITGPCKETSGKAFLASEGDQYSPGGLEVFRDEGGRTWVVYAVWNRPSRNGRFYCCRSIDFAELRAA